MTMPAGTYYVGDLCYVFEDDEWTDVCSTATDSLNGDFMEGEFNLSDGIRFAMFGTAYGDGEYMDQKGRCYLVDSGTIGCVRIKDIPKGADPGGQIIKFDRPFEVRSVDGKLMFGDVVINTKDDDWNDMDYDKEVFEEFDR